MVDEVFFLFLSASFHLSLSLSLPSPSLSHWTHSLSLLSLFSPPSCLFLHTLYMHVARKIVNTTCNFPLILQAFHKRLSLEAAHSNQLKSSVLNQQDIFVLQKYSVE